MNEHDSCKPNFCMSHAFFFFIVDRLSFFLIITSRMDAFQTLSSIFMLLCSIMGIICALIFIAIVAIDRRCRTLIIFITFNTVLAGLLINIVYASQAIYQLLGDTSDILCPFRGFLLHCSAGLFYHTLCIQAFYRLFVTVYAQRRHLQSTPFIISIIILQWIISVTFALPILLMNRIKFQTQGRICQVVLLSVIFISKY